MRKRDVRTEAKNAILSAIESAGFYGTDPNDTELRNEINKQHERIARFLGMEPKAIDTSR